MNYSVMKTQNFANVSTDRIFVLQPKAGGAYDGRGMLDKRLLTGSNKLHAVQDAGLWYLKYEVGAVPGPLKQKFTNFNQLYKFVKNYYDVRNVDIIEVID